MAAASNDRHVRRERRPAATDGPVWLERVGIVIPALDAESTLADVIHSLREAIPERSDAIIVIDDGSRDATARVARDLGCTVITSGARKEARPPSGASINSNETRERPINRGKGAALRAGFEAARARGMTVALTVDADGQHPAEEVRRVLFAAQNESTLVLGVRDLVRDGAPRANRFSNGISNHFLSRFAGRSLRDTQCGLRRYPIERTLALRTRGQGYDFEAEVLLRAVWAGFAVVEEPIRVLYPEHRRTHFRVARDPWRIIRTVVTTVRDRWLRLDAPAGEP